MRADGLWAVLPVKAWSEAKRRLSPILSGEERQELARSMLDDVLRASRGASRIAGTLAVTADEVAAAYLEGAGCELVPEHRRGLNRALRTAAHELRCRGAATMLVLPVDLPLVTAVDLDRLCIHHLKRSSEQTGTPTSRPAVTVAPDRFRSGTNALVCSPPGCIPFRFGDGSFHAHLHEAKRCRAVASSLALESLGLDVDHPDDLAELLRRGRATSTERWLRELDIAGRLQARSLRG